MKKVIFSIYVIICALIILTNISYGYLDPSAMTYIIQMIAAIFISISTTIGILLYKLKKKFLKKEDKNDNNAGVEIDYEKIKKKNQNSDNN